MQEVHEAQHRRKPIKSKNLASISKSSDNYIIDLDADVVDNFPRHHRSNIIDLTTDTDADVVDHYRRHYRSNLINLTANGDADVVDEIIALHDENHIFPISNKKLQLQEARSSSLSHPNASLSSQNDKPSSSSSVLETSSPPNKLKMKQLMETDKAAPKLPDSFCGICMDTKPASEMFSNTTVCSHLFCSDCISQHVSVKIKENIAKVKCPDPNCKGVIGPELCRSIVPKEVLERWEDALCESMILGTQKFYCPFKDCSAMLVDDGGQTVTSSECPNCNRLFCAQCKVAWHGGMDCGEFKSSKNGNSDREDLKLKKLAENNKWRKCPSCNFYVEKRDGCNFIKCRCGSHFCYGCGVIKCVCNDPGYRTHVGVAGMGVFRGH